MGTRGAVGFRIDGADKVTYNHFDSYPDGLGIQVMQDIAGVPFEKLVEVARGIQMIDPDKPPTEEQIALTEKFHNMDVSNRSSEDWYCLLREAQGGLTAWIHDDLPIMSDSHGFLGNSLFCEWAYIVNLDDRVLEVYKGFQKSPGVGRYSQFRDRDYYGVSLLETIPLSELPTDEDEQEELAASWQRKAYPEDEE